MSIDRLDFDNLSQADLLELVQGQVPESLYLEYKRELYGDSDAQKRELHKDVSAFANAFGGHLVVGIKADQGIAIDVPGAPGVNPDDEVLRLEQLLRSGIEPRIQGLRVRPVRLDSGSFAFVLRVPRSWVPPHRVNAQNSNRFYVRHSGGVDEASMEELRTMFTLGSTAFEQVRRFHRDRVAELLELEGTSSEEGDGRLIMHIVPLASVSSPWRVDLKRVYELHREFEPIGDNLGMTPRFNIDGFRNARGSDPLEYTQIFRNGVLEASRRRVLGTVEKRPFIPGEKFERLLIEKLPSYVNGLKALAVPAPLVVLICLAGCKGAHYAVERQYALSLGGVLQRDKTYLPECIISDYGEDAGYRKAIKPAFDALWNLAERSSDAWLSEDGEWNGPRA